MDTTLLLRIIGLVLFFVGGALFYTANIVAKKIGLPAKTDVKHAEDYSEEELEKARFDRAVIRVKLWSLAVLLPGIVLVLIAFR